jgi:TonB family protein
VTVSLNPPGSKRQPTRRVGFWLAIAALIHAELGLLIGFALYTLAPRDADIEKELAANGGQQESIDIGMVDEDAAREIVADLERQEEHRKAEEIKKEVDSIKAPGQVVDVPVPREEKRPDEARFASEHDTTVEKEMKKYGKFDEKARQGDASGQASESRPETPRSMTPDRRLAMRDPQLGRTGRTPGLDAPVSPRARSGTEYGVAVPGLAAPDGVLPQLGKNVPAQSSGGSAQPGGVAALMPSEQQLARAVGSGSQDALKDVDDGDETALNSKRWKFASFFNRLKKQVAEHWHPDEAYRRRDPTGSVYGTKNRLTILRVQLKPDGSLANVALEQPSGVEFLDDEAIEAFKQAQPFLNPPRQMVDSGGVINFRFGFLFELSGGPPRLFRYND